MFVFSLFSAVALSCVSMMMMVPTHQFETITVSHEYRGTERKAGATDLNTFKVDCPGAAMPCQQLAFD